MKKITLVLMIIVLSVFMSANVTMAKGWKYFKGTYAMSATGSCIHSENGYIWGTFIDAVVPGVVYAGTTVSNGTWIFKKDGTGTYSYTMYATVTPPVQSPTCGIPGGIRIFEANDYTFTYEVTHSGNITIETQEGDTLEGTISRNKKTIVLLDDPHEKGPLGFCPWYRIICTATRTLMRMH
jgi:hypothetical protein